MHVGLRGLLGTCDLVSRVSRVDQGRQWLGLGVVPGISPEGKQIRMTSHVADESMSRSPFAPILSSLVT